MWRAPEGTPWFLTVTFVFTAASNRKFLSQRPLMIVCFDLVFGSIRHFRGCRISVINRFTTQTDHMVLKFRLTFVHIRDVLSC